MEEHLLLPYVVDKNRIIPNDMVRSSLFTISNHNRKREYYTNQVLYTFGQTELTYRGEELRQDDEDVWLQLLYLASSNQSSMVEFMPYSFMADLGWPKRTQYRDKLKLCLERMTATKLSIRNKSIKTGLAISLVRKFTWIDDEGNSIKRWKVCLEPEIIKLFANNNYSKLHWEQRKKLNPLAKWLHSYYNSHAEPFPISMLTLQKACGSKTKSIRHFKVMLRDALLELVQIGCLRTFFIDARNHVTVRKTVAKQDHRKIDVC